MPKRLFGKASLSLRLLVSARSLAVSDRLLLLPCGRTQIRGATALALMHDLGQEDCDSELDSLRCRARFSPNFLSGTVRRPELHGPVSGVILNPMAV